MLATGDPGLTLARSGDTEGLVHFTTQWGFQTWSRCHSGLASLLASGTTSSHVLGEIGP
jgi:hypothetical protein